MKKYLFKIFYTLEKDDINRIVLIFFLSLICSITELISIGLIIPLLQIFSGGQLETDLFNLIKIENSSNEVLHLVLLVFLSVYFIKFFLNKILIKKQNSFSHFLFAKISKKFFKLYLNKDFNFFVKNNSSDLIRNILSECNLYSMGVVFYLVQLFSEIIIFTFISIFLIYYNPQISLIVIVLFTLIGAYLFKRNSTNLKFWGNKRHHHSAQALKQLQQSFGSFRELIMNNLIEIFYNNYSYHTNENAKVGINKDTVTQMPRLLLEILAVSILVLIVIVLTGQGKSLPEILVLLGVFFYSTIRLLPSVSKIVKSVQNIKYNNVVIDLIVRGLSEYNDLSNKLKESVKTKEKIEDFEKIVIKNVFFSYSKEKEIFKNLNLEIKKGEKIGIVGKTGSGKSTLINILCGLLNVSKGDIYFDNIKNEKKYKLIQNIVGYVPQSVSILDETIQFNVCLTETIEKKNFQKLKEVLKLVDLDKLVESLSDKYNSIVGENGSRLSGGQNQRLGIARAIFKKPKILILDEATSALDLATEEKIIKNILKYLPNLTIISISHRPSSLHFCDKIFQTIDNSLVEIKNN